MGPNDDDDNFEVANDNVTDDDVHDDSVTYENHNEVVEK